MPDWPNISVVVPTFNREESLIRCLGALLRLDYPENNYEIIIIDDCSTDNTEYACGDYLCSYGQRIHYIKHCENLGAAAARNTGIRSAKGEYVAFLDDDCSPHGNWLKEIVQTFRRYPEAAAVGGGIINGTDTRLAWASYLLEFSSWFPAGKTRRINNIAACNIAYKKCEIACCAFPEEFKGLGFEDSLFNYNIISSGKTIIFNPEVKVTHYRDEAYFHKESFYRCQERYALGFVQGGYRVFGRLGVLFVNLPVLNLFSPRLLLVFFRCLRSRENSRQFILNIALIVKGEWLRNKIICIARKKHYA